MPKVDKRFVYFMWDDELQDKIAEMRAKYARIDIDQEIDNWIKEVMPDGV